MPRAARRLPPALLALLALLALPAAAEERSLVVGAKVAPPFVMRGSDGGWSGISVEAWRAVAEQLGLAYEFRELELGPLFAGLQEGTLDAGIGALTVTAEREGRVDFTHAFYGSGLGMAVSLTSGSALSALLANTASGAFLRALGALVLVLLAAGALVWIFERRRNPEQFGGSPVQGLLSGFWWSAVTMTTVGYGDKAPVTPGGRLVALVWMFTSIVIISGFTAAIASTLTISSLAAEVDGPEDLPRVSVATVDGTTSDQLLEQLGIAATRVDDLDTAIDAAASAEVQVVVYDRPILQYAVRTGYQDRVRVLPHVLRAQLYAFALPPGSRLREPVNRALLAHTRGDTWSATLERYLGE